MLRHWRLLTALLILMLLLGSLFFVFGTTAALRLGLSFVPGLQVTQIEGRLWGGFELRKIHYQQAGIEAQLKDIEFRWQPWALLKRKVQVSRLYVNGLQLSLPVTESPAPAPEPTAPMTTLPDIALPVQVFLDDIQINYLDIQQGEQKIHLGHLHIAAHSEEGRFLLDDFNLQELAVDEMLALKQASLVADMNLLAPHRLHVQHLRLQEIDVTPPPPPATSASPSVAATPPSATATPMTLPDIELPLDVAIDQINIQDFRLHQPPNELHLKQLILALHTEKGQVFIDDFQVQQLAVQDAQLKKAQLQAELGLTQPHALNIQLNVEAQHPQSGPISLKIQAQGDTNSVQLDTTLQATGDKQAAPILLSIKAQAQQLLDDLRWQADIDVQGVNSQHSVLQPFLNTAPALQMTTHIKAEGDLQHLQANMQLRSQVDSYGDFTLDLSAENLENDWQQWRLDSLRIQQAEADLQLQVQGTVDLRQTDPQITAQVDWQALRWPLQGDEIQAASPQGSVHFAGTPAAYTLSLDTQAQAQGAPDSRWQLKASGSTQAMQIESLRGELLDGWLQLSGDVGWQPQPRWDIRVQSQDINPGTQWKDWPGQLGLEAHSAGEIADDGLQVAVDGLKLEGRLREYPLQVLVDAAAQGTHYRLKQVRLQSGQAHFQVQGEVQDDVRLDWQLNAPQLQALYPQAQGRLSGQGKIGGDLSRPTLQAQLEGKNLIFDAHQLKQLQLDTKLDIAPQGQMHLDLKLKDLNTAGTEVESISLQAKGTTEAHTVDLTAQLAKQSAQLNVKGGLLSMNTWQGHIQNLQLKDAQWGRVKLQQPAALQASAQRASLEQTCLQWTQTQLPKPSQLCLQGDWKAVANGLGEAHAALKLDDLALDILKPFLPENLQLQDFVTSLQLDAELRKNGDIRGDVALNLTPGQVRLNEPDAKPLTLLDHQGTQLTAKIDERGLVAQLNLRLPQQEGLQAQIKLPKLNHLPLAEQQPLTGDVSLTFADFSLLPVFAPQVSEPKGRIEADVKLGGFLSQPAIEGELRMRDGGIKVDLAGLDIHDMQLAIRGDQAGKINLDGQLRMGENSSAEEGLLRLNGDFLAAEAWQAQLNIKGERLEVMNSPEIWLLASPDLQFEGSNKRMALTGKIVIPEALLTPPETEGGGGRVSASGDVVIVQDSQEQVPDTAEQAPATLPFFTQLQIVLADKISVKGMGFKGRLQGDLQVFGKPDEGLRGNGRITVLDGTYKAYGQDLRIRRGNVLYSGGPVENPGLDVQAVRVVADVTAGIEVSGTAQEPELTLFSEPALDQTNILSYIVLGRPASGGGGGSINQQQLLAQALSDLALNEDSAVSRAMRDDLGLDTAGLDTSGGVEQTTFMLGKYLTPDLYISYGVGLFDAENIFRMRYRLSQHFSVESATSGGNSGVDLHYSLER